MLHCRVRDYLIVRSRNLLKMTQPKRRTGGQQTGETTRREKAVKGPVSVKVRNQSEVLHSPSSLPSEAHWAQEWSLDSCSTWLVSSGNSDARTQSECRSLTDKKMGGEKRLSSSCQMDWILLGQEVQALEGAPGDVLPSQQH